jgi:hypothetical protein
MKRTNIDMPLHTTRKEVLHMLYQQIYGTVLKMHTENKAYDLTGFSIRRPKRDYTVFSYI